MFVDFVFLFQGFVNTQSQMESTRTHIIVWHKDKIECTTSCLAKFFKTFDKIQLLNKCSFIEKSKL